MPVQGFSTVGRSGMSSMGADCSDALTKYQAFDRLSKKQGPKYDKQRQAAISNRDYWFSNYNACINPPRPVVVQNPVNGVVQNPIGDPIVVQQIGPQITPQVPYVAPVISSSAGGSVGVSTGGPVISPSIDPGLVASLNAEGGTSEDAPLSTGAASMTPLPSTGAPVPTAAAASQASQSPAIDECSAAMASKLPLEYPDQFGPMKVLRVICA